MKFNNIENENVRLKDGREIWISRAATVVGMLIAIHDCEKYVLLVQRGEELPNEVGKWCMPCGYLDWNETLEEAVVREIYEESGISIPSVIESYDVIDDRLNYPWKTYSTPGGAQNLGFHYALVFSTSAMFMNDMPLPAVRQDVDGEVSDVRWVKISDLMHYDIAFNHDTTINIFASNIEL